MKKIIASLILLAAGMQPFAQIPVITSWIVNTTGATGYAGISSNVQLDQFDSTYVYISCTCIPGYSIGPWTGNPNIPKNQNFVFKIPRNPVQNTGKADSVGLGQIAVWSNGVAAYNASDGMTYNNDGVWHRNAYYFEGVSFDNCLGHPDQSGCYHHHVSPTCLYNDKDSTNHSPIIGYAFDGYPIYGAYGYKNVNGTGGIKRMTSSYQLRKMVNRDTLPNGTVLSSGSYGPAVSTTYPLGDFMEDYTYTAGSGDLDSHNGRFCVTPDYPAGTYAYFVTLDETLTPEFPYVIGYTYYGTIATGNTGPGGGHITPPGGTVVYTPTGINEVTKTITCTLEPNPTQDYAYIYIDPSSDNNITATLYNSQGQLLKTYDYWHPSMSYALNLSTYPAGVYFLNLQTENTHAVQKIVKVN
ncbi:MAG TPA: YHYH protein [Bacteroidia bacterium]|nr:YHYH protein [Bacteroidia bacterium]